MNSTNKAKLTVQQRAILECDKKNLIVSASAGSGKTFVVIEYLKGLLRDKHVPLSKMLVLTFTKAAAGEMKSRLTKAILECEQTPFLSGQLDEIALADISTIHAFCEKLLKRYIGLLPLPQNFGVLDEKQSSYLKLTAFNHAFEHFSQLDDEDFNVFYNAFKKNKELMLQSVEGLAGFLESQRQGDGLAEKFALNYSNFNTLAKNYLLSYAKEEISKIEQTLMLSNFREMEEVYSAWGEGLLAILKVIKKENFLDICQSISQISLERFSTKKTSFVWNREMLARAKEEFVALQKLLEPYASYFKFEHNDENNHVANAIVKVYAKYRENYAKLKQYRQALDFSDLERYAQLLLGNQEILKDLQARYDYIFVDEYQDTNPLQEGFVKQVAMDGHFIAVGDPKQGIYGFRNASMEIMKRDIQTFSQEENSQALYLNGNFRSGDHILQFVNVIFDKHMTEQSVGIDYAKTSRLTGLASFKSDGFKPVEVDLILPPKEKSEGRSGIYSVKEDTLKFENKNELEVMAIASHIEKYLAGSIYDGKQDFFRAVQEGDIAILFRKRTSLMEEVASYLQKLGHNVICDSSSPLLDDGEIASIISFVKLALSDNDEIALASSMCSAIGGFSPSDLIVFRGGERSFRENLLSSQDNRVKNFFAKLEKFKNDMNILGLEKALKNLMEENFYYVYLSSCIEGEQSRANIENLFKVIRSGEYDFNPSGLIQFLQEKKSSGRVTGGENAILLCTIHATKGLEYPIVILAGCGESMVKADLSVINYSQNFGLGTNLYDFENNTRIPSLIKLANRLSKQKREYIDELMIFYVALTRGKNHLVLTGTLSQEGLKKVYQNKTYLSLVLNAFGENFVDTLCQHSEIEKQDVLFSVITQGEEEEICIEAGTKREEDEDIQEIKQYINFTYPNPNANKKYKNSVTSIMEEENQNIIFSKNEGEEREDFIERGNAYHEALKIIPFEKINSLSDIDKYLDKNILTQGYYEKIDKNLLLKNILIIKNVLNGQKAEKEREFIMSTTLQEIKGGEGEDKIIIQGIIDLFSLGEKNILIDYKYTSQKNENKIKEKYLCQIKLYEKALIKAFGIKLNEKYILSLKEGKLIKIED